MSSIIGKNISVSVFGQSHSPAIGVTIDGLPAGIKIDFKKLQSFLDRRIPGQNDYTTARKEADVPEFISGLVDDVTCGAPLTAIIKNTDCHPTDYASISDIPRPAHADYSAQIKFGGFQDKSGGGHFSGRLTAPLCVAGGIILQILEKQGITVSSKITSIGKVHGELSEMLSVIADAKKDNDSVGGTVECTVNGVPAGVGDPVFDGVENCISKAVFAIPAIKGIEFGSGFAGTELKGSENNDSFVISDGKVVTTTNNHGGILGGITSGMPIVFRVAIKPTPSIAKSQKSVELSTGKETSIEIKGRHDPCIVPRALPCVEAAAAIAIYDLLISQA